MAVIIIAEDDAVLRFDLVDLLQSVGFQVIEASCGEEALAILQTRADICGVFTDILMPGSLDRLQLAAMISARWPEKFIVIGSGNDRPKKLPEGAVFLSKPYDTRNLTEVVVTAHRQNKT